ncbi:N-acetyltransferase family protein [Maritalea sp.]|uniref:GNAT family N-acetyltransferase n=1 Tax=Maritalea sp. TaxID=2003361 RepID=UPI003EFA645C
MTMLTFRHATRNDIATILRLSIGGNAPGRKIVDDANDADAPEYQRAWDVIEKDPSNFYIMAELEGDAVGCMQINILHSLGGRGKSRAQLEGIHIRADQRGKGLGSQMIQWAIDQARSNGARLVQLTSSKVRPEAHRLYKKLGFENTHEGFKLDLTK